jgi:hypothetical protein
MDESQVQGGNSVQNSGGGTFQGTNIILDPFNLKGRYGNGINLSREYGRSDLDIRGRFVGSFVYTPVFHTGMAKPVDYAVNGWELSGTYTASSGQPLTSLMNATIPSKSSAFPTDYTGLNGGATGEAVTLNASSGAGRVPFLARNNAVFSGIHNADIRAGRNFPVYKTYTLSVFAEVFNLANHREVASVASSAYEYIVPGNKDSASGITCPATNTAPCIAPYSVLDTATPFGTPTTTSGVLFGARQMQFVAKFNF